MRPRPRIPIRGSVRPSVRPSVHPSVRGSVTRLFQWADYRRKWSEMTRKTVQMLPTPQTVFRIVPKCPKMSQNVRKYLKMFHDVHFGRIVVRTDLLVESLVRPSVLCYFVCYLLEWCQGKQRLGDLCRVFPRGQHRTDSIFAWKCN